MAILASTYIILMLSQGEDRIVRSSNDIGLFISNCNIYLVKGVIMLVMITAYRWVLCMVEILVFVPFAYSFLQLVIKSLFCGGGICVG